MNFDIESRIIESFSKHVKSYDRHAQLQKSMAERLASFLPDPLPPIILELGCGTGIFTRHLLARGAKKLFLNDIAPAMIQHLSDHMDMTARTEFLPGNAENLTFPQTGLIVGNAVFQWFQNPESTLIQLKDSLNEGGSLLFSTFGPGTLQDFRKVAGFEGPTHLVAENEWRRHFKSANLKLVDFTQESREIFFPNTRNLLRNLQQIGAAPLPVFKSGRLRQIISEYDRNFTTGQGVYTHWELFYFHARG